MIFYKHQSYRKTYTLVILAQPEVVGDPLLRFTALALRVGDGNVPNPGLLAADATLLWLMRNEAGRLLVRLAHLMVGVVGVEHDGLVQAGSHRNLETGRALGALLLARLRL